MATVKEMMMQDAAASIETSYMMAVGDTFEGTITNMTGDTADWVAVELEAGTTYQIGLSGRGMGGDEAKDTVLTLRDSKGGMIDMNDDINSLGTPDNPANLNSSLKFRPTEDGTYYIDASSYNRIPGDDNSGDYLITVEALDLPADIVGTDLPEKIDGTDASESIHGLGGNDTINGMGGDDEISGGDGNDFITGGPGADEISGGKHKHNDMGVGGDTISYEYSALGVTINLNDGTARGGDAEGDDLSADIENVRGSMHDDTLTGTDEVTDGNSLWGLGGNDVLTGREGPDRLSGGAGDDVLDGGDEDDTLEGGYGADTLTGGLGADTASYAGSMMGVTVRLHSSQAMGGDAEGDIWGDVVTVPYTVPAEDEGDPPVEMEETVPDIVHLTGSAMDDILAGDSRDNTIRGGDGDDKIYGGPGGGDDKLFGGDGDDMVFGGRGNESGAGADGTESGGGLYGGDGNDMLHGGPGEDDFYGGQGDDMIYAEAAANGDGTLADGIINGGSNLMGPADTDTVSFARMVDAQIGSATNPFTLGTANVMNIERVIGTDEDDFITGADATGTPGNADFVPMPEEIEGGDGGDVLVGGDGGGDTVSYESSDRRVRVDLADGTAAATSASGGHATGDSIVGFENVKGSAHGDVLTARSADTDTDTDGNQGSTLWGLGGDDTLEGGAGDDTIEGGAGADEVNGGYTPTGDIADTENSQTNTLSYAGSDAGVTVNLVTATASGGHADGDEIETYDFDTGDEETGEIDVSTFADVTGSMHDDRLTGDGFANHLAGGGGDDRLSGGAGADILAGGPGADRLDGGEDAKERNNMVPDPDDEAAEGAMVDASEDWAAYRGAMEGVTVNLNTGMGTAGAAMGDTLRNIELIWGSMDEMSGDTFIASEGADYIHGDGGSDTVSYEASKHRVIVELPTRDDTGDTAQWTIATGTPGNEDYIPAVFNAAEGAEVMAWRGRDADNITVRGERVVQEDDGNASTKSYAEGDVLASIENITGSRGHDIITGDGVPNVIKGGAGNDTISGGAENDKLHGGAGNDVIGARPARDLDDNDNPGESGVPGEALATDAGDDMMYGDAGNDKIYGGEGDDTLVGGAGDDDLTGGTGNDTFVFGLGNGSDVIITFEPGTAPVDDTPGADRTGDHDFIDLSAFGIRAGDLPDLLSERAGNVIVNLEDYGGGRITIQDEDKADLVAVGLVHNDMNGDVDGVGDGSAGIFIL